MKQLFITGIDTDAGKSIVTGVLARWLREHGIDTITQKMAQTGCTGVSEDIETHRRLMGCGLFAEDISGFTCAYMFPFPAAPSLSARLVGERVDVARIAAATERLSAHYDCVLVEGVGGLMVPLDGDFMVIDYMARYPMDTILVSNGRLGSVNHTLLSLEICRMRGINVVGMVYNDFIETDPVITEDTFEFLRNALERYYPGAAFVRFPKWTEGSNMPDFSGFLR